MTRPFDVMAAGHLCLDVIPRFPQTGATRFGDIIQPGKLVMMKEAMISTGGPVSNTGIGLKILGNKVCFCARVGDDAFGRLTQDLLRRNGNADGVRPVTGSASSYTVVLAPPGIDRVFLHNPGTNDEFAAADLDRGLMGRCRVFHLGYPPLMRGLYQDTGAQLAEVFRAAKAAGATTSLDMSLPDPKSESGRVPWAAVLEKVLPFVDIFLPSIEEVFFMLEPEAFLKMKAAHQGEELIHHVKASDYSRLAARLLDLGARMTSLKCGDRGFYFRTGKDFRGMGAASAEGRAGWAGRELWCPAFSAPDLASATGSGDSSIAGFLTAYLRGLPLEQCLKTACMVGWQNVQVLDAVSGIKDWDTTQAMLAAGKPMNDLRLDDTSWRWDEQHQLAVGPADAR